METKRQERRYQRMWREFTKTRVFHVINAYVVHYGHKGWNLTKKVLWTASTGAVLVLLPLAIETTIEGEAQALSISSQISGGSNPNIQYRPY